MNSKFLLVLVMCLAVGGILQAEDRSFDGTGNNLLMPNQGAAFQPLIRINYPAVYPTPFDGSVMLTDAQRPNPRTISNIVVKQSGSIPSARGLSDLIWGWGQFLSHDMSHAQFTDGGGVNGVASISIDDPADPIYPGTIPFVRSNFVTSDCDGSPGGSVCRQQVNEITSYIDASNVYGSDAMRASALRTDGGSGARLLLSSGELLPHNTLGLPNENHGSFPTEELFVAGDIRSNENPLLTSLHTVFAREHNRLVGIIETQQPDLTAEETYQLARKLVGAELQRITYHEFLPALLGPNAPAAEDYAYDPDIDASITQSFATAIYRWGHSTVSPEVLLVNDNGTMAGSVSVQASFFNPTVLAEHPERVEQLLRGAATQSSQELDVYVIEELRSQLFGPPGAGGLDLPATSIQRGRDHGLPDYHSLGEFYGLDSPNSIAEISSDPVVVANLQAAYNNNIFNIDPWLGALAEDHLPDSSAGQLTTAVMVEQFERLRDGDRLFYLSNDAGLYLDGVLRSEIAAIVDLDTITLTDIILANTLLTNLQANVFFSQALGVAGDYNNDGLVTAADYVVWRNTFGSTTDLRANGDATGASATVIDQADYLVWRDAFVSGQAASASALSVPEPHTFVLLWVVAVILGLRRPVTTWG